MRHNTQLSVINGRGCDLASIPLGVPCRETESSRLVMNRERVTNIFCRSFRMFLTVIISFINRRLSIQYHKVRQNVKMSLSKKVNGNYAQRPFTT